MFLEMQLFFKFDHTDSEKLPQEGAEKKTQGGDHGTDGNEGKKTGKKFSERGEWKNRGCGALPGGNHAREIERIHVRETFDPMKSKGPKHEHEGRDRQTINPTVAEGMVMVFLNQESKTPYPFLQLAEGARTSSQSELR